MKLNECDLIDVKNYFPKFPNKEMFLKQCHSFVNKFRKLD